MYTILWLNLLQTRIPMAVSDATLHQKRQNLHEVDVFAISSKEQSMDFVADHWRMTNCFIFLCFKKYFFFESLTCKPFHVKQLPIDHHSQMQTMGNVNDKLNCEQHCDANVSSDKVWYSNPSRTKAFSYRIWNGSR